MTDTIRDPEYALPMSILEHEIWPRIRSYLHVVEYDKDGGHQDPRVRIEFLGIPDQLSIAAQFCQMACVGCGRAINPLRRREGDGHDRLYYAPTCQIGVRIACSRSGAAAAEYERFKACASLKPNQQLALF